MLMNHWLVPPLILPVGRAIAIVPRTLEFAELNSLAIGASVAIGDTSGGFTNPPP